MSYPSCICLCTYQFYFTTSEVHVSLKLRLDAFDAVIQDNKGDGLTAPTSDRTAGIGAEFETPLFCLTNSTYGKADTDISKRQLSQEPR